MTSAAPTPTATTDPALRELALATDTAIADLVGQARKVGDRLGLLSRHVRKMAGATEKIVNRRTGRSEWDMTVDEALDVLRAGIADGRWASYEIPSRQSAIDEVATRRAELADLDGRIRDLDQVWRDNGCWPRFYLVNASNGHIHRDVSADRCSRQVTTDHGWLPDLAALTEADAVAAYGPRLCSTCFPTAPVEWTVGKPKPARCDGSGKAPVARGQETWRVPGRYRECSTCHTAQIMTGGGVIRAHKPE